jgi:hypothetical protein
MPGMWRSALCAVLLVACTSSAPAEPTVPPSPTGDQTGRTPFVRGCDSSVYGDLGPAWRRGEITAGPVVFVGAAGYADDPEGRFGARGDLATAQKVLIVVTGDRPVVVSVRHPDAALAYDPERWRARNVVPFRLGDPSVRFAPCGGDQRRTQFNGAFLLTRDACVPVEVRPQAGAPIAATISFGASDCA